MNSSVHYFHEYIVCVTFTRFILKVSHHFHVCNYRYIETVFQKDFVRMFMVYLNKEFEKPTSSGLLANHNKTES
jgi:hypothetical protein